MGRDRGFIMMDVAIGIMILGVLMVALAMSLGHQRRAMARVRDTRDALRLVERVLADVRISGQSPIGRTEAKEATVTLTPLPFDAPRGWRWVEVRVAYRTGAAEITGLIHNPPPEPAR